jgi:hypothetical protein
VIAILSATQLRPPESAAIDEQRGASAANVVYFNSGGRLWASKLGLDRARRNDLLRPHD